jgi:hypothetical protein
MTKFKYLKRTATTQNCIHEEIKSRLISGNACYRSVQRLLSSRILSKNLKIKIYQTIILLVVLYGCKTSFLIQHTLRLLQNGMLRIFGPKREEVAGGWRRLHNEELHNLYTSPYIVRVIKSRWMN